VVHLDVRKIDSCILISKDLAQKSKARLPTIAVVFGSSTAGGAYSPGMSDYVIMVKVKLIFH
jgi:acetyl-CoA carboxylase carboxyltransferase component